MKSHDIVERVWDYYDAMATTDNSELYLKYTVRVGVASTTEFVTKIKIAHAPDDIPRVYPYWMWMWDCDPRIQNDDGILMYSFRWNANAMEYKIGNKEWVPIFLSDLTTEHDKFSQFEELHEPFKLAIPEYW